MKIILFVIAMGVMLNLISCATPTGESSDKKTADTLTMEELEENFDSCQLGNTLDSIAHIEKINQSYPKGYIFDMRCNRTLLGMARKFQRL